MQDLPKKVSAMSMNSFEKLENVYLGPKSAELKPYMTVNGNLSSLLRGSPIIFENQSPEPVIKESNQKNLTLKLKLDSKQVDSLIVGLRIRIDGGKGPEPKVSIKIMNREPIKMKPRGFFWYDIPLCDSEIICVQ